MKKAQSKNGKKPFGAVAKTLIKITDYFIDHPSPAVRWPGAVVVVFISVLLGLRKKILEREQ